MLCLSSLGGRVNTHDSQPGAVTCGGERPAVGSPCGGEPLWTRRGRPFVPFEFSWPLPVPPCVKFSDVMTICTSSDFIVTPARPYL